MLAILYDIHGNRPALDAVLLDARASGARRFLLGGDYAAFGAWPVECVEILRGLGDAATWIRGNWERWQAEPSAAPDSEIIQGAAADVDFGHTHLQFRRSTARGIELVNPGSVGLPWDGDTRAAYALAAGDGTPELRRVDYDVEEAAGALDLLDTRWATVTARRLRTARFDV
jgi:predicted phosphodiesterase